MTRETSTGGPSEPSEPSEPGRQGGAHEAQGRPGRARRQVHDAQELRALAHPVRVELLELLLREGPMTATQAGAALGQTPANCSFHLRVLARHGYVEEAAGGVGRQRPWRLAVRGVTLDDDEPPADVDAATGELLGVLLQRELGRLRSFLTHRGATETRAWRDAGFSGQFLLYLTPEELAEVSTAIQAVTAAYEGRGEEDGPAIPQGARACSVVSFGYPLPPTPSGR